MPHHGNPLFSFSIPFPAAQEDCMRASFRKAEKHVQNGSERSKRLEKRSEEKSDATRRNVAQKNAVSPRHAFPRPHEQRRGCSTGSAFFRIAPPQSRKTGLSAQQVQTGRSNKGKEEEGMKSAVSVDDFFLPELCKKSRFKLFPAPARLCKVSLSPSSGLIRREELPFFHVAVML